MQQNINAPYVRAPLFTHGFFVLDLTGLDISPTGSREFVHRGGQGNETPDNACRTAKIRRMDRAQSRKKSLILAGCAYFRL